MAPVGLADGGLVSSVYFFAWSTQSPGSWPPGLLCSVPLRLRPSSRRRIRPAARWSSRGPFGGEVFGIAVDPTDGRVAYAALGSIYTNDEHRIGGVFKTFDGGSTWKEIGPPDTSFFSVAVAPSDHRVVFASSYDGLWKSADGGVEWNMVLPGVSWPAPPAIDPADPLHVWVVSNEAAWRTLDGGSTWTEMFRGTVGFDSGRPSRLHRARLEEVAIDRFGLRFAYSDDRGETWTTSTTFGVDGVRRFVSDASDPDRIYSSDGRFRSTDRGVSWMRCVERTGHRRFRDRSAISHHVLCDVPGRTGRQSRFRPDLDKDSRGVHAIRSRRGVREPRLGFSQGPFKVFTTRMMARRGSRRTMGCGERPGTRSLSIR